MKSIKNILVTGAGSLLGQGILRLLRECSFEKRVYTADPSVNSAGHWLGDHALTIPLVNELHYEDEFIELVKEHKIDLVLVGTDVELPILSRIRKRILEEFNCRIIVSNETCVSIANDKYLTAKFLEEGGFRFPFSVMANNKSEIQRIFETKGLPLFAKPKDGARSYGIKKIKSEQELFDLYDAKSNMVIQEYLDDQVGEFTSGCLVVEGKCESVVTLKRDLRDGNTYRTFRDRNSSKYDNEIAKIAEAYNPTGPVNFQFRVIDDEPVIFEINCRFSGTTPLRSFYGFNEVQEICRYYLFGEEICFNELRTGVVMRTVSDLFVSEEEYDAFQKRGRLVNPKPKFYNYSL